MFFYPACSFFQLSHALETFTYILQPVPFFTLHHSPVHSIVQSFNRSFVQSFIVFIPSSVSGTTIIYCLYYYSFSIHFRDHLAIILNVTVGFLSLLYLVLFTPIVLISFLLGPFCQLSPRRRLFKLCTRAYTIYIFILYTKSQISQPKSNYFC